MTTKDGHVKWVCRHHYRAVYQEAHTQKLRDVVKLTGGVFDDFAAAEFYEAISKAKAGVYDLDIGFGWDCSRADLEAFEKALEMSSVSILRFDLQRFQASITGKLPSTSTRYETLLSIEMTPQWIGVSDFRVLVNSLKTNRPLTTLNLENSIENEETLTLSGALITNTALTTLDLRGNSIGMEGALSLSEALKTNTTLTTLNLWSNSIGNEEALALSEALKTNSTLTTLNLWSNSIGNEGALALSEALKTNTALTTLHLGSLSSTSAASIFLVLPLPIPLPLLILLPSLRWRHSWFSPPSDPFSS
ncbi:hypothetical protein EDD21DRAFT_422222 [Dissophora ornata]|nr:hypothetical protein EDD21DRAFT_422222 [Dissophora ornata]